MSGERLVAPYEPLYASPRATYIFRGVMVVFSILQVFAALTFDRGVDNLYYVSHVGGVLVALYYIVAFIHSFSKHRESDFLTFVLTIVFQMTAALQFLIFVFYWALMSYEDFQKIFADKETVRKRRLAIALVQHLVYPVLIWFTLLMERTTFKMSNSVAIYLLLIFYCAINYYKSSTSGTPVYDIINWSSMESHINLGGAGALVLLGFYLSTKLSIRMSHVLGFDQHQKSK
jgi:hypothetical protein